MQEFEHNGLTPEQFQTIVNQSQILIWRANTEAIRDYFSPAWLNFTGRSMNQEIGNGWIEGVHPNDSDNYLKIYLESCNAQLPFEIEYQLKRYDGKYRWIRDKANPYFNSEGDFQGYIGYCFDITKQKLTEGALRESNSLYESLVNQIPQHLYRIDLDGKVLFVNQSLQQNLGVPSEDILGKTAYDFYPKELAHKYRQDDKEIIRSNKTLKLIEENISPSSGEKSIVEVTKIPIYDDKGNICGIQGVFQDITEQKNNEERLRKYSERLNEAQRIAGMGDFIWQLETGKITWSKGMHKLLGYDESEKVDYAKVNTDIHHPEDLERITNWLNKCIESGNSNHSPNEYRLIRKDGKILNVQTNISIKYKDNKAVEVLGTCFDISKQKQVEEHLAKQANMQQVLIDLASKFINVPLENISNTINNALANIGKFFSVDRAYIFQYDWQKKIAKNTYEWCAEGISAEIDNMQALPFEVIGKWVELHAKGKNWVIPDTATMEGTSGFKEILQAQGIKSLITFPMTIGENCIGCVGFDSVKQHKAYTQNEEDLLLVFSQMLVNIKERTRIETEKQKTEKQLNEKQYLLETGEKIFKHGSWEWNLQTNEAFWSDGLYDIYGRDKQLGIPEVDEYQSNIYHEDWDKLQKAIENTIHENQDYHLNYRIIRYDNQEVRVLETKGKVIRDNNSKPVKFFGVARDVTELKHTEQELIKSKKEAEDNESFLEALLQSIDKIVVARNKQNEVVFFNKEFDKITKKVFNKSAYKGLNTLNLLDKSQKEYWLDNIQKVLQGNIQHEVFSWQYSEEDVKYYEISHYPVFKNDKIVGTLEINSDVTSRKKAEQELIDAKERAERILLELKESQKVANIGSWYLDFVKEEVIWSEELYKIYGFDANLPLPSVTEQIKLFTEDSWNTLSQGIFNAKEKGIPYELELETIRSNKKHGWLWTKGEAVYDEDKKVIGLRGVAQDVTERKQMEMEIFKSKEEADFISKRFQTMFHQAPLGIALIDSHTGVIYEVNLKFAEIAGRTIEQMKNIDWMSITHPDDVQEDLNNMKLLNEGKVHGFNMQKRYIKPNGDYVWINMTIAPVVVELHESKRHLCMIEDITERKQLELDLINAKEKTEENAKLLKKVAENFPNSYVSIVEKDLTASFVSGAEIDNQGLNSQDYIGVKIEDIFGEDSSQIIDIYQKTFRGEETRNEIKFGNQYLLYKTVPLPDDKGYISKILVVSENISEQKERELELKKAKETSEENEKRLLIASKSAQLGIFDWDVVNNILVWDDRMYELFGQDKDTLKNPLEISTDALHPEDQKKLEMTLNDAFRGIKDFDTFFRIIKPDSEEIHIKANGLIIRDEEGKPKRMIGINRDITEFKNRQALLEAKNKQLIDFSNIIAHNLRSPLVNIEMLVKLIEKSDDIKEQKLFISKLKPVILHLNEVFNELIESIQVKQDTEVQSEQIILKERLNKVLTGFESQIDSSQAEIKMDFTVVPVIHYPKKYIDSIFSNLVSNALKYKSPNRKPLIIIKTERKGDTVLLSIADNGLGIDMSLAKDKLFKIRKTFHNHPEAKGFGLFMIKTQIETMGGEIWVESTPNIGSTFYVKFKNQK